MQAIRESAVKKCYGHLSGTMKDHLYEVKGKGFIFTSPWVCTNRVCRPAVTILLSSQGKTFEVIHEQRVLRCNAFLIAPRVERGLRAQDVGLVSVNIAPKNPVFPILAYHSRLPVHLLRWSGFTSVIGDLIAAYEGTLTGAQAGRLMGIIAKRALDQIRQPGLDASHIFSPKLRELLFVEKVSSLAALAKEMYVSKDRASRIVAGSLGIPPNSYFGSYRMGRAWRAMQAGASMTEAAHAAGFTDASHLTRTFVRTLGAAPSFFCNRSNMMKVID